MSFFFLLGLFVRGRRGWNPASRQSRLSIWLEADAALVLRCGLGGDIVAACMRLAGGNESRCARGCLRACLQACAFTFCPSDVHKAHGARGTSAGRRQPADYPRNVTFTHSSAQLYPRRHACMLLKVIRARVWSFPRRCSSLGRVGRTS